MEKLLFVYNPCSGKGQIRGSLSQVIEILSKKGYDVTVYPTKREMDGCETVEKRAKEFDLIVVRLFMLSAHYRNPINFSKELIMQAKSGYERIMNCRENLKFVAEKGEKGSEKIDLNAYKDKFIAAMDDDLNTADAIGVIFELVKDANTLFAEGGDADEAKKTLKLLDELLDVLGLLKKEEDDIPEEIKKLAEQRANARKEKNWALADELRDKITAMGYALKDTPQGVKITKA